MRIAFISDIHGNLIALDAVLAELERESFDRLICLGDVAAGPQPQASLERVRALDCPVIMGNWDAAFLHGMPEAHNEVEQMLVEITAWWAAQLSQDDRAYIETFTPTLELPLGGRGRLVCFHGSPRSYDDWIFPTTPDGEVARMLSGFEARVMVGGHTHLQMMRRLEVGMLVNPGSVGLPFLHWWPNTVEVAPWAEYALIDLDGDRIRLDLRRAEYDVAALLRLSRSSEMPHADWWGGTWAR